MTVDRYSGLPIRPEFTLRRLMASVSAQQSSHHPTLRAERDCQPPTPSPHRPGSPRRGHLFFYLVCAISREGAQKITVHLVSVATLPLSPPLKTRRPGAATEKGLAGLCWTDRCLPLTGLIMRVADWLSAMTWPVRGLSGLLLL